MSAEKLNLNHKLTLTGKNTNIVSLLHISNPYNSIMCTLAGCLDFSDVIRNPKLMDMSLKMARQSNTVNFDNEMCSCEQFPASLLLERDKNIIWTYVASYLKSAWAGLCCALLLIPPLYMVILLKPEQIHLTGMLGMWNLLF